MTVIQYPHTGKAYKGTESVKGSDGNWTQGSLNSELETICRVEPAKANQYINGADGKRITFTSIVYMPIPELVIIPGMLFEVWEGERLIVKEPVKQFSKGQLNARVWL
jgi:hypothetical protein